MRGYYSREQELTGVLMDYWLKKDDGEIVLVSQVGDESPDFSDACDYGEVTRRAMDDEIKAAGIVDHRGRVERVSGLRLHRFQGQDRHRGPLRRTAMTVTRERQEELLFQWAAELVDGYRIRDPDCYEDWKDLTDSTDMSIAEWEWCRSNLTVTRTVTVSLGETAIVCGHVPGSRPSPQAAEQIKRHIEALQVALEDGTQNPADGSVH